MKRAAKANKEMAIEPVKEAMTLVQFRNKLVDLNISHNYDIDEDGHLCIVTDVAWLGDHGPIMFDEKVGKNGMLTMDWIPMETWKDFIENAINHYTKDGQHLDVGYIPNQLLTMAEELGIISIKSEMIEKRTIIFNK